MLREIIGREVAAILKERGGENSSLPNLLHAQFQPPQLGQNGALFTRLSSLTPNCGHFISFPSSAWERIFAKLDSTVFDPEAPFGSEPQGRRQTRRELAEVRFAFPYHSKQSFETVGSQAELGNQRIWNSDCSPNPNSRRSCSALTGLWHNARFISQGVALGYLVAALQAVTIVRQLA